MCSASVLSSLRQAQGPPFELICLNEMMNVILTFSEKDITTFKS